MSVAGMIGELEFIVTFIHNDEGSHCPECDQAFRDLSIEFMTEYGHELYKLLQEISKVTPQ